MRKIVIPIALLSVAVNLILGGFLMSHYYSIRPTIKRAYKEIWFKPSREEIRALEGIVSLVDSIGFETPTEQIDHIRNFVFTNSVHKPGAGNPWNTANVVNRLYLTFSSDAPPAHLTCGPRALAMQNILEEFGIQSRFVQLFTSQDDYVRSHSVLDVLNPHTSRWEMQDPDYNLCLFDRAAGRRASTTDALLKPLDVVIPLNFDGASGWENLQVDFLKCFYSAGLYGNIEFLDKPGVVKKAMLVNTARFDSKKQYPKNGDILIEDFTRKRHGDPIYIFHEGAPEQSHRLPVRLDGGESSAR